MPYIPDSQPNSLGESAAWHPGAPTRLLSGLSGLWDAAVLQEATPRRGREAAGGPAASEAAGASAGQAEAWEPPGTRGTTPSTARGGPGPRGPAVGVTCTGHRWESPG